MEPIILILKEFGLPVALLCGFVFWAYQKDKRQEKRYDELGHKLNDVQGEQRHELLELSKRAIKVQEESNNVQSKLIDQLQQRPCIARGHDVR